MYDEEGEDSDSKVKQKAQIVSSPLPAQNSSPSSASQDLAKNENAVKNSIKKPAPKGKLFLRNFTLILSPKLTINRTNGYQSLCIYYFCRRSK